MSNHTSPNNQQPAGGVQNPNAQQQTLSGSGVHWSVWVISGIILAVILFFLLKGKSSKDSNKLEQRSENAQQTKVVAVSNTTPLIDTTFRLNPGDTSMRFKSREGYILSSGAVDSNSNSTRYKLQVDDEKWKTYGDGNECNIQGGSIRLTPFDSTSIRVRVVYLQKN